MNSVEEIYNRLSPEVSEEIRLHAQMSGTLQHLLKRLQIPPAHGLLNQHRALFEFVAKFGDDIFLEALRKELTLEQFARLKAHKLSGAYETAAEVPDIKPFRKPAAAEYSPDAGVSPLSASQQKMKIEAPVTSEGGLAANDYSNQKPLAGTTRLISTPSYRGPDRRTGRQRRMGRGRRETVTPLFGGERRQDDRRYRERRGAGAGTSIGGVTGNRRQGDRRKRPATITFADRRRGGNDRRRTGRS